MSVSLYRKYRPARFEDIIGQGHVARTLVNAINQDRVSHAYLFTGPRGTGKTSTAKILAMALNCEAGHGGATAEPDGTCQHCEAIRRGSSLDVVEMDAASNRGIDDIRDLRDKVHFAPVESRMKVYIVDEVHMLTAEAFNALLKTLEEPPTHAVFILATTEPHKVPATILSRCQRFDFRRPSLQEVSEVLGSIARQEGIEVEESSLIAIARAAGGSFRDAIGTLDQLATYSGGQISLEQTLDILGVVQHDLLLNLVDIVDARDTKDSLLFVEQLNQAGTDYNQFMKDLLGYLRDLYVVKHTEEAPSSIALSDEQLRMLRAQAGRLATVRIVTFIDLLGEALRAVRQGSDPRLELELVLIKMTAFGHNTRARHICAGSGPGNRAAATGSGQRARSDPGESTDTATRQTGDRLPGDRLSNRGVHTIADRSHAGTRRSRFGHNHAGHRPPPASLARGPRKRQETPGCTVRGLVRGAPRESRGRPVGRAVPCRLRLPGRAGGAGRQSQGPLRRSEGDNRQADKGRRPSHRRGCGGAGRPRG
jgi:DNA polymerase III subunit gamma/tau